MKKKSAQYYEFTAYIPDQNRPYSDKFPRFNKIALKRLVLMLHPEHTLCFAREHQTGHAYVFQGAADIATFLSTVHDHKRDALVTAEESTRDYNEQALHHLRNETATEVRQLEAQIAELKQELDEYEQLFRKLHPQE